MGNISDSGASQQVKDLAEGFSTQSKLVNKMWLTVVITALLILVPDVSLEDSGKKILPFGIGKADANIFNVLTFFVLSLTVIAFCSARAQALLAYDFALRMLDNIEDADDRELQRKFFHFLLTPTFLQVSPLSILAKNTYGANDTAQWVYGTYYFIIKHLAIFVFFGIPFLAIAYGLHLIYADNSIHWLIKVIAAIIGLINMLLIIQNWAVDTTHTKRLSVRLSRS